MAGAFYSMEMPNAKLVQQGLENLNKGIPEVGRKTMFRFAQKVSAYYAYSKKNPPRHSKYVRTMAMKKSRRILKEELGYVFVMDPEDDKGRRYAAYVVGTMRPDSQARWHQDVWIPLREVVATEAAKLAPEIQRELGLLVANEAKKANAT